MKAVPGILPTLLEMICFFSTPTIDVEPENVGVMASLALSQDTTRNVVLTGSLASLAPAAKTFDIFNQMHDVFGIDYIIPPHPSFATAVGALLCDPLPEN